MTIVNGNVYTITNYSYSHANIANWERGLGTYEDRLHNDQFWLLEESKRHKGFYYIVNTARGNRIAKWGGGDGDVGAFSGKYYDDQLWRFERHTVGGMEVYRIWNKVHSSAKLAKWGKGDGDFGTYSGANHNNQLWTLTPKYKVLLPGGVADEKLNWDTIFEADNRKGSKDFQKEVTVTTGLTLTNSKTLSTKLGTETSLKVTAAFGEIFSTELTHTISTEISTSMSSSNESQWSSTTKQTFIAPAGKNYRVRQRIIDFESQLPQDSVRLYMAYKISETSGDFTD